MLETLREYALERLAERADGGEVGRRHAVAYLGLAAEAETGITGEDSRSWLERLDHERENLHAAVGYALAAGDADTAQLLCGALWRYWLTRGLLGTGGAARLRARRRPRRPARAPAGADRGGHPRQRGG